MYAPKVFAYMAFKIGALVKKFPHLVWNYRNSLFPASTMNCGPRTATRMHRDRHNAPGSWCAITAFGDFDSKFGGHLILPDWNKLVQFPAGSTILIPSGSLWHGNTSIQGHKSRYSITQYFAGGLNWWAAYGFRKEDDVPRAEMSQWVSAQEDRWAETVGRFSKVTELVADIQSVFALK